MITLKEQEIYRILQTKDPAIATLEGYGIKKKVMMFVEKNPHYRNIDFTINDYDKQVYSEATRLMVRRLLLNGYTEKDIYGINRQINNLAESFYKMPLHKILSENSVRQVKKLLEVTYVWNGQRMVVKGSGDDQKPTGTQTSGSDQEVPLDVDPETGKPLDSIPTYSTKKTSSSGQQGQQKTEDKEKTEGKEKTENKEKKENKENPGGQQDTAELSFLANMAQKVLKWAEKANIRNFGMEQIEKVKKFMAPVEGESTAKSLGRMVTGWIAIISAVVGAAFLAKWLIKLFLKAVKGGVNALKKFFGIFSAKTKIPLENPNE
jgi:hypothetical protein